MTEEQRAEFTRDENYFECVVNEFNEAKKKITWLYDENIIDKGKGVKARKAERVKRIAEIRDTQRSPFKEVDFRIHLNEAFHDVMEPLHQIVRNYEENRTRCDQAGNLQEVNDKYLRLWRSDIERMMYARTKLTLLDQLYQLFDAAPVWDWGSIIKEWIDSLIDQVLMWVSRDEGTTSSMGWKITGNAQMRVCAQFARDYRISNKFTRIGSVILSIDLLFKDPKNIVLLIPEGESWQDIES